MNLLSGNAGKDLEMKQLMLDSLAQGLSSTEMETAEKFFDFSKEMNISLLDGLTFRETKFFRTDKIQNVLRSLVYYHKSSETNFKYADRYILFLDKIFCNYMFPLFTNYFYYSSANGLDGVLFGEYILHALEQCYSKEEIEKKTLSYHIEVTFNAHTNNFYYSPQFVKTAQERPEVLLDVADNYCYGNSSKAKMSVYALLLAYDNGTLSRSDITKMEEYLYGKIKEASFFTKNDVAMTLAFLSVRDKEKLSIKEKIYSAIAHDSNDKIRKYLTENIKGNEHKFVRALFYKLPQDYLSDHIEKLFSVIGNDKEAIFRCTKTSILHAFMGNYSNPKTNADIVLRYICKHYPEQFAKAMKSEDEIMDSYISHLWDKHAFQYYGDMYEIAEKENPQLISDYHLNLDEDILNFVISSEKKLSDVAQKEIGEYLSSKADISVLEPYFNHLAKNYHHDNYNLDSANRLVRFYMKINSNFKNRYYALKVLQYPEKIVALMRWDNEKNEAFDNVVKALLTEKIPVEYQFNFYDIFYNDYNIDKPKVEKIITNGMVAYHKSYGADYDNYCPTGSVLARKTYVMYLGQTNTDGCNNEKILALCGDTSKEVKKALLYVMSQDKSFESAIKEMLTAKKIAIRELAVDVLESWGTDNYEDLLNDALQNEKSVKLADKIRALLSIEKSDEDEQDDSWVEDFIKDYLRGGKINKVLWLYQTPNKEVHFKDGTVSDERYLKSTLVNYADMQQNGKFYVNPYVQSMTEKLVESELNAFAADIFSKWLADGADTKKKWVLYYSSVHGGNAMVDILLKNIKTWAENMRGAIAAEAVKALAMQGSSYALMSVDNMAHKFKQKQVRNAAVQALENVAEQLGITADELGDRIVPDLGFNENMERIFDYGTRKFKVYLTPSLELEVFDEKDKKLKTIPAPSKKDDEETAKQSNAEFKQMKKQLKNVISIQKARLETALLADRRWNKDDWEKLFVKNPVMHSFAIGLIWCAYSTENDYLGTFRYMEDGSFNTADEDEFELEENCTIGLVHPIDLDTETLEQWKEQLSDYEITQPIEQLDRKVYKVDDKEVGKLDLARFNGREVNGMSLLGRTSKAGWYKGSVQDGGGFNTFYREDVTKRIKTGGKVQLIGNAVELTFEGMYVGGENEDVKIENARFYQPGTVERGSYCYDEVTDEKAIALDKVNPRYFSEIVNQLEMITKETNSD